MLSRVSTGLPLYQLHCLSGNGTDISTKHDAVFALEIFEFCEEITLATMFLYLK